MSLLWVRPAGGEARYLPEERRVRDFVDTRAGVSESVASLSTKLGIRRARCQRTLEQLVEEGVLRRLEYADIEPIYCRYPGR